MPLRKGYFSINYRSYGSGIVHNGLVLNQQLFLPFHSHLNVHWYLLHTYIYFAFIKQINIKLSGKCTQLLILTEKKSFHLEPEKKEPKKGFGFYACTICKIEPSTLPWLQSLSYTIIQLLEQKVNVRFPYCTNIEIQNGQRKKPGHK